MTVTRFHFIKAVKIHQVVSKIVFCSIHLLNTASGSGANITKSSGLEVGWWSIKWQFFLNLCDENILT